MTTTDFKALALSRATSGDIAVFNDWVTDWVTGDDYFDCVGGYVAGNYIIITGYGLRCGYLYLFSDDDIYSSDVVKGVDYGKLLKYSRG